MTIKFKNKKCHFYNLEIGDEFHYLLYGANFVVLALNIYKKKNINKTAEIFYLLRKRTPNLIKSCLQIHSYFKQ